MNHQTRILISLGIVTFSAASLVVACSDDPVTPNVTPTNDATTDTSQPQTDSGPQKDVNVSDTNVAKETGSTFNPNFDFDGGACAVIGNQRDDQANFTNPTCNACLVTNCCKAVQDCLQGDIDGSIVNADGGYNPCSDRYVCFLDNCATAIDAGGCQQEKCDPNFSTQTNDTFKTMHKCIFGPQPGTPVQDTCSYRPADGGLLCAP